MKFSRGKWPPNPGFSQPSPAQPSLDVFPFSFSIFRMLWEGFGEPWKVQFSFLRRREGACDAVLCSGKSNWKGGKAAIVAVFKEKRLQRLCVLEIFDNISNINYWHKKNHLFGKSSTAVPRKAASLERSHKLSSATPQQLHKSEMISSGTAVKCYSNNTSLTFE